MNGTAVVPMNALLASLRWFIITFLLEASVVSAFAQNPSGKTVIQVGQNIHVSREMSERPITEPQIAADPKNPIAIHLSLGTR